MSVLMLEETAVELTPCHAIQKYLQTRVGDERFDQWFAPPTQWQFTDGTLTLRVVNAFSAKWIRDKFLDDLRCAGEEALGFPITILIETVEVAPVRPQRDKAVSPMVPSPAAPAGTMSLNDAHTLEEFVVGPTNQLAYKCACTVAEEPRRHYSPLFIHGDCGMGKTHLLQGICRRFQALHPKKKWLYITGEQFTNEYLESIRLHRTEAFRRRVRQVDLLVVDDVHFFMNKKHTQEEFLHTFNAMDAVGRQVVLSSDCAPRSISALTDALSTRFSSGMVARVDSPDLPTRLDILRRLSARRDWAADDSMLMLLAQQPVASVRELQGLLVQAVAVAQLCRAQALGNSTHSMQSALSGIRDHMNFSTPPGADRIIKTCAEYFSITAEVISGSSKQRVVSTARSIAMYLVRLHTHMSYPDIARAFDRRNHSTVIGACNRVDEHIAQSHIISWTASDGPHHQAIAEALHTITARLRRP